MRYILVLSVLAPAMAAAGAPPSAKAPRSVFQGMDADRDGKVTEPEYRRSVSNWFNEVDENQDMKVTAKENAAAAERRFRLMDADDNGAVSSAEYLRYHCGTRSADPKAGTKTAAPARDRFQDQDLNGDRTIDRSECALFRAREYSSLDRNSDGKLTLEEVRANAARQFEEADADEDGALSPEEWLAYFTGAKKRPAPSDGKSLPDPDARN